MVIRIQISRGRFTLLLLASEFSYQYLCFLIIGYFVFQNAKAQSMDSLTIVVSLLMNCFTTQSSQFFLRLLFSSWFPIWSSLRTVFILSIHQSSSYEATEACAKTAVNRNGRALLPLPFLLLISHKHRFTIHTSIHHVITRKPFHLDIAAFVLESRCITHFPW